LPNTYKIYLSIAGFDSTTGGLGEMGSGSCRVERLGGVTTPGAMPARLVPNHHLGELAAVPDRYKGLENFLPLHSSGYVFLP
jgi:hypothetical protein